MPDAGVEEEHGVVVPDVVALERGHVGDGDVGALGSCILSRTGVPPPTLPGSGEAGADAEAMPWKEEMSEVEPRASMRDSSRSRAPTRRLADHARRGSATRK